ncbi:hypothetical protein OAO01_05225 [Oligoflexia bacterium]|nr:hypothetical protein [Oligoflexia bacterium]
MIKSVEIYLISLAIIFTFSPTLYAQAQSPDEQNQIKLKCGVNYDGGILPHKTIFSIGKTKDEASKQCGSQMRDYLALISTAMNNFEKAPCPSNCSENWTSSSNQQNRSSGPIVAGPNEPEPGNFWFICFRYYASKNLILLSREQCVAQFNEDHPNSYLAFGSTSGSWYGEKRCLPNLGAKIEDPLTELDYEMMELELE